MSRGLVAEMLAQQNTRPIERPRAHYLQRMPEADLVRGQDGLS
jgi:citrate synthase